MTKTYYKASGIWLGYLRNLTDLFKFKTQGFWIEKPEVRKLSGRLKSSHFRLYGMRVI
jgi:hypothetical protein